MKYRFDGQVVKSRRRREGKIKLASSVTLSDYSAAIIREFERERMPHGTITYKNFYEDVLIPRMKADRASVRNAGGNVTVYTILSCDRATYNTKIVVFLANSILQVGVFE